MILFEKIYTLDQKKVGLFPREKLLCLALKARDYSVRSIYQLVPFKFWSLRSAGLYFFILPFVLFFALFRVNFASFVLRCLLLIDKAPFSHGLYSSKVYRLSLVDSVNKKTHHVINSSSLNQAVQNLKWIIYYIAFTSIDSCLILLKGLRLLSLRKTAIVVGDIFYNTETLISILLLVNANSLNERGNALYFFSGIKSCNLFCCTKLSDIRNPSGPYGSELHSAIRKRGKVQPVALDCINSNTDESLAFNNFSFEGFVLYPPCVSDSFNFTLPSLYTNQVQWLNDVMICLAGKKVALKMHPMAEDYGDVDFWKRVSLNFSKKYGIDLIFLPSSMTLDDVLRQGLYPLSPKGTVGLELIMRKFPAPILSSNAWTDLFPRLLVESRQAYKQLIRECVTEFSLSPLSNYLVGDNEMFLAEALAKVESTTFLGRLVKNEPCRQLPVIRAGSKNRLGNASRSLDKQHEALIVSSFDSSQNHSLLVEHFEELFQLSSKKS